MFRERMAYQTEMVPEETPNPAAADKRRTDPENETRSSDQGPFSFELELERSPDGRVLPQSPGGPAIDTTPPPPPRFLPHRIWGKNGEELQLQEETAPEDPILAADAPLPAAMPPGSFKLAGPVENDQLALPPVTETEQVPVFDGNYAPDFGPAPVEDEEAIGTPARKSLLLLLPALIVGLITKLRPQTEDEESTATEKKGLLSKDISIPGLKRESGPKTPEQEEQDRLERERRRRERRRKEEKKRERQLKRKRSKDAREEKKEERKQRRARQRDDRLKQRREASSAESVLRKQNRSQKRGFWEPLEGLPLVGPRIAAYQQERAAKKSARLEEQAERGGRESTLMRKYRAIKSARSRRLGRNIVGLELGSSHLRAVMLKEGKPIEVFNQSLPDGIIVDGFLEEPEELTRELKRFWQENKISSKKVNFSVSNRLVTLCTTQLAAQRESDIPQALSLKADVLIAPMDPNRSIVDYAELSRSGPNYSLQVAAADEAMVKKYARAIEKAGLLASSCEIGALAMSRSVRIPYSAHGAHLIVDIGKETTSLISASGTDVFQFRNLEIGGNDFTRAIQEQVGCSWAEADRLKQRSGIATNPAEPGFAQDQFRLCREAMREISDQLAQEIAQTKRLWEGGSDGREISSWTLLGGGAKLNGLREQIALFAGLPEPMNLAPFPGLEEAPTLDDNATVLGLARPHAMSLLPDADALNFNVAIPGIRRRSKISLNRARREAKKLNQGKTDKKIDSRLIAGLIAIAILGGSYYYSNHIHSKTDKLKEQTTKLQAEAVGLHTPPAPRYTNSPEASTVARQLFNQPDPDTLTAVAKLLAQSGARSPSITQQPGDQGAQLMISGFFNKATAAVALKKQISALPGIAGKGIRMALHDSSGKDKGKGFAITLIAAPPLSTSLTAPPTEETTP